MHHTAPFCRRISGAIVVSQINGILSRTDGRVIGRASERRPYRYAISAMITSPRRHDARSVALSGVRASRIPLHHDRSILRPSKSMLLSRVFSLRSLDRFGAPRRKQEAASIRFAKSPADNNDQLCLEDANATALETSFFLFFSLKRETGFLVDRPLHRLPRVPRSPLLGPRTAFAFVPRIQK